MTSMTVSPTSGLMLLLLLLLLLLIYLIIDHNLYVDTCSEVDVENPPAIVALASVNKIKERKEIGDKLTVRVNTFRRNDLIAEFLEYYHTCPIVAEIQIIWSDTDSLPPEDLVKVYSINGTRSYKQGSRNGKGSEENSEKHSDYKAGVKFEVHKKNSLANRFKPSLDISTDAVLSIDDDLIVPCDDLTDMMNVWRSNSQTLVGYSPRMYAYDLATGSTKYLRWQHTWWSGYYSIMLTKVAILHKKYLKDFADEVTDAILNFIDENRNCEDIAMAHIVAAKSGMAPVWTNGLVYEIGQSGISSGASHFSNRGHCLEFLRDRLGSWPWVTGEQKMIKIKPKLELMSLWR